MELVCFSLTVSHISGISGGFASVTAGRSILEFSGVVVFVSPPVWR
jgi:hypothetical protein